MPNSCLRPLFNLPFAAVSAAVLVSALVLAGPGSAATPKAVTPSDIVAAAPKADWVRIAPSDLMVMDLAPGAAGQPRRVVIQLMPAPFSQGWIGNIRKLETRKNRVISGEAGWLDDVEAAGRTKSIVRTDFQDARR